MNLGYLYVSITIIGTVIGQILMKIGANKFHSEVPKTTKNLLIFLWEVLTNPYFFSGLSLAFISAMSWIFVLKHLELTQAYPFTALTIVLVMTVSFIIFNETITAHKILGSATIIIGILIISQSK